MAEYTERVRCMPRSPTPASASLLPEDSFSPPEASDTPANQQGGPEDQTLPHAADGQSAKPIRTDPSKVPKWLKLPVSSYHKHIAALRSIPYEQTGSGECTGSGKRTGSGKLSLQ
ncbi:hypothetical protein JZ751_007496 [Albula glossodonta]|uniref:Uncharacterized protein n=1 Tax=Albula glossodonta TaxID=121402 RepID=A0A8T2N579_9TELE|nr:hypothetical protein JZ751_007496 [Albula glossodonta]